MLVEIYNWFTEGFDTADLKDAKALLDELRHCDALREVRGRQPRGSEVLREVCSSTGSIVSTMRCLE